MIKKVKFYLNRYLEVLQAAFIGVSYVCLVIWVVTNDIINIYHYLAWVFGSSSVFLAIAVLINHLINKYEKIQGKIRKGR